jgi:hypothetical protein
VERSGLIGYAKVLRLLLRVLFTLGVAFHVAPSGQNVPGVWLPAG